MGAAPRRLLLHGICAVLIMAAAVAASGDAAAVVVGLAKCADCTRKNMKAEAAFNGLQVAIRCKNGNGKYESKAVAKLDSSGAFSVPLAADLLHGDGADCLAQLHSAAGAPCPGQEPSQIVPQSEGTFVAVPGKTHYASAECASATICGLKKHFLDHFHKKKQVPPKPKPEPQPEYHPPTPTYGSPTPIYHLPARQLFDKKKFLDHFHKGHDHHHFFDKFHKKPVPPKPKPEPKPQPEYHPPTPTYGSPTPIYHPPERQLFDKKHFLDHFHKDHHHFFDKFHKKPVPPKPKPEPEYHSPTPTYGSPTPIYHPPERQLFDKKHFLDHFHKDHDHHFFDKFHKKPVPPKPKPEPKPEPEYHSPTPTYGSPTPMYHPPERQLFDKKHFLDHFHKGHDHHFFDKFHKKPVPPKPEPKPQPEYHPPTPTYGSPTPIYHPPTKHWFDKKHFFDHFHKSHDHHHFFDKFHKKPVPPKPEPEPKPQPEYHSPTPTYGSPTPIYHPPSKN